MALTFGDLSVKQIIYLLLHGPLPADEEAALVDRIRQAIARGDIAPGVFHEPITQAQIAAVLSDPNTAVDTIKRVDKIFRDAGTVGALPTLTALLPTIPDPGLGPAGGLDNWVVRQVRSIVDTIVNDPETSREIKETFHSLTSDNLAWLVKTGISAITTVVELFATASAAATPIAGKLAGQTMNQILGVDVKDERLFNLFSGAPSRDSVVGIGQEFQKVVDLMFPIGPAQEHSLNRGDRSFAIDNLEAFMGTNMAFQLRSLSIGTIASFVPHFNLEHLEGLHNTINWAYGFGWLSWTVLAAVMQNTTTKPLQEYYNAKIKPNDFTEQQAINAFIEKRIDEPTLNHILDNHGVRDDTRPIKIDMDRKGLTVSEAVHAFFQGHIDQAKFNAVMDRERIREDERQIKVDITRPDLAEGDIQALYDRGERTESEVTAYFVEKGFDTADVGRKTSIVKRKRLWHLQDQLATTYYRAFVREFVEEEEYTQYLQSLHYSAEEVAVEIKRAEVQRKEDRVTGLTKGEVIHLVADGGMSATEGLSRLVADGIPSADAALVLSDAILQHAVGLVPLKVRQACLTANYERNLIQAAITSVIELDPLSVLRNTAFFTEAKCILDAYTAGTAGTPGSTPPAALPPAAPPVIHSLPLTQADTDYALTVWKAIRASVPLPEAVVAWMVTPIGSQAMLFSEFAVAPA